MPDLYQGNELIDLSLVDPDNRRPVDYARRDAALRELETLAGKRDMSQHLPGLAATPADGRLKLWLTFRLLDLRRQWPAFFRQADYQPLTVSGSRQEHVIAFTRSSSEMTLVVATGRLYSQLLGRQLSFPSGGIWRNTAVEADRLPRSPAVNILTGEALQLDRGRVALDQAFATLPAAVFVLRH